MKNKTRLVLSKAEVKAFIIKENGEKFWFDIPKDTAEKVLRLQKMFRKQREKKQKKDS
jgi:hypothetical protein